MEPGPLPPHERSWRHPSELGPTRVDVDKGSQRHVAALVIGTLAVLGVAGMVVAMTPRPSAGPVALSATTTPASATTPGSPTTVTATPESPGGATASAAAPRTPTANSAGVSSLRVPAAALLSSFSSFPHAITSSPQLDLDGTDIADQVPEDGEMVMVRTEAVTYEMPWGQVASLGSPTGTVIFDGTGDLVAHFVDGELITIVDD